MAIANIVHSGYGFSLHRNLRAGSRRVGLAARAAAGGHVTAAYAEPAAGEYLFLLDYVLDSPTWNCKRQLLLLPARSQ